jgi:hypothetical protein
MQYFYDGQIRRYLTQIVRAFSNFSYQDGDGDVRTVPVMYGDITRQVANIIRDNSENKLPSAPRMGVYITGLQMDRARLSDSSYVSKINIKDRTFDSNTSTYDTTQAKGYTVERLHPTPYTLSVNIDVWSTSTDQKLQILEQIFMLFNPDLEFQTTDNYIDWTSLSVLQLENINFSSRTIPSGTETEIDVATLGFIAPIYISPPVKVKKLGVITDIITSVFNNEQGTINLEGFNPPTDGKAWSANGVTVLPDGTVVNENGVTITSTVSSGSGRLDLSNPIVASYRNFDVTVQNGIAKLVLNKKLRLGEINWLNVLEAEAPAKYQNGISQVKLYRAELGTPIVGTFTIGNDKIDMLIDYDIDTLPSDTVINGPARQNGSIDYVINPITWNPSALKVPGTRALLTGPIGGKVERKFTQTEKTTRIDTDVDYDIIYSHQVFVDGVPVATTARNIDDKYVIDFAVAQDINSNIRYELYLNEDGADAWKNTDTTDFVADANDIVEWDGNNWHVVFDASETSALTYVTNLNTNQQLYWNNFYWQASVDGYYPRGTWELVL